jgi:diaminohydroxyphosphoribosylaminopyrimidine deaminase/5-amino-6-(5-phosphoribosylamino)uracil reductase
VAGQGAQILKDANIEAEEFNAHHSKDFAEIRQDLEEVCEAFLWNFRQKKVFVALKMASSLDGQVALKSGESQWITGPQSREYVHYLRACYDAILVGKGTVEFDNPSLNIRHPEIQKNNKIVIIDGEADLLANYANLKLSEAHDPGSVFWCVSEQAIEKAQQALAQIKNPPQVLFVKTNIDGNLDLENLLEQLYGKGLRSIMVEGGAMTASSFIDCSLVNRLYMFQAPIIMGSGGSRSWTESVRVSLMKDKIHVKNPRYLTFGDDFMITGIF